MNIEHNHNGWYIYATDDRDIFRSKQYCGYTKRQAVQLFRRELKQINNQHKREQ